MGTLLSMVSAAGASGVSAPAAAGSQGTLPLVTGLGRVCVPKTELLGMTVRR